MELIESMYEKRADYYRRRTGGFHPPDIYAALIDVDTKKTNAILIRSLDDHSAHSPYLSMPIVDHLATKATQDSVAALLRVVDDRQHEFPVRLLALEALSKMSEDTSVPDLAKRIDAFFVEIEPHGESSEFVQRTLELQIQNKNHNIP